MLRSKNGSYINDIWDLIMHYCEIDQYLASWATSYDWWKFYNLFKLLKSNNDYEFMVIQLSSVKKLNLLHSHE